VGLDNRREPFLFRGITRIDSGKRLDLLSYTSVREQFRSKMLELGYYVEGYGLHSLRACGDSAAAQVGKLFKEHSSRMAT